MYAWRFRGSHYVPTVHGSEHRQRFGAAARCGLSFPLQTVSDNFLSTTGMSQWSNTRPFVPVCVAGTPLLVARPW